jgi:hypothetical protein
VDFRITDTATGRQWSINPDEHLSPRQVQKMVGRPDNILQYARYLHDAYARDEGLEVEVRANAFCSVNYRAEQRYIDPDVDLAKQPYTLLPSPWILPFERTPLPSRTPPVHVVFTPIAMRIARIADLRAEIGPRDGANAP